MTHEKIIETNTFVDENGNSTSTTLEKSISREKVREPDYIKIYTNMWCEFNEIPMAFRQLFLELALRMTYCNSTKLYNSQLVSTGSPYKEDIMQACGWTSKAMYQRGLQALCKCGAIKRVNRGVYQINPSYAGKGKWLYDSKAEQGGIKDLIAEFDFGKGTCNTRIIWADNGDITKDNEQWRKGLGVSVGDDAVLKETVLSSQEEELFEQSALSGGNEPDTKEAV